jgi:hypothetical protein
MHKSQLLPNKNILHLKVEEVSDDADQIHDL